MAATLILPGNTAAGFSRAVVARTQAKIELIVVGFGGPDAVVVEISGDQGVTWADTKLVLNFGNPTLRLDGPGLYRVNKGVTIGTPNIYAASETFA